MATTQQAIIDTATRVIKRLTTDASPMIDASESIVSVPSDIDLSNGPWKLDNSNVKTTPTTSDIQNAGLDKSFNQQKKQQDLQGYKDSIDAAIADKNTSPALVNFLQALKKLQ